MNRVAGFQPKSSNLLSFCKKIISEARGEDCRSACKRVDSQNEALWNGKTVSGPSAQTLGRTLRSSALPPDEGIGLWRSQPQDETPKMRRLTTSYILPL
jgi:hypothetical protein